MDAKRGSPGTYQSPYPGASTNVQDGFWPSCRGKMEPSVEEFFNYLMLQYCFATSQWVFGLMSCNRNPPGIPYHFCLVLASSKP